jgi:hypothetical protein
MAPVVWDVCGSHLKCGSARSAVAFFCALRRLEETMYFVQLIRFRTLLCLILKVQKLKILLGFSF